ncbi:MAG: response regulator [Salinarimonadaceae bacterium]|nr:MAG: response regulator [Salinarimonadaceae bacterium]
MIADASNETRRSIAAAILSHNPSLQVIEAVDGETAAARIVADKPDVLFVNVKLPGMSGAEAVAIARSRGARPVTILISDQVLTRWVALSTEVDAYEFLKSPYDPAHVVALMRAIDMMRKPLRVQIVVDAENTRAVIRKMLAGTRFNLNIEETNSGAHAIKLLQHTHFDLSLIDLNLAGMDGLETACKAKEIAPETALVMLSGAGNERIEATFKHFGFSTFLQKPFLAHHVEDMLHEVYDLRRPYLLNAIGRVHKRHIAKAEADAEKRGRKRVA